MDLVAKYLLAFLLSQNPALEPAITWFFNASGCTACVTQQLALMKDYYRDGDAIIVHIRDQAQNPDQEQWLRQQIAAWNANAVIETSYKSRYGVGWIFHDRLTGEKITMVNGGGQYNRWRAEEILKLIR